MNVKRLWVLLLVLFLASAAQAEGFVGGAIGYSGVKVQDTGVTFDESDTGWKVYGGYRFFKVFGVEGGYTDLGSPSMDVSGGTVQVDPTLFDVWAVGVIPITFIEIYGKVGYAFWDADFSDPSGSGSDDGSDIAYGAGIAFKIGSHIRIRVQYELYDIEGADDVNMASAGFDWRF